MLSRPVQAPSGQLPGKVPLGLFPTYCMPAQSDRLELAYSFGRPTVVRTNLGEFLAREVTTGVLLKDGATPLASGKVVTLSTYVPTEGEFTPAESMKVAPDTALLASGIVSGMKLSGLTPQYPVSARMAHASGKVILHAIIGTDGRIHRLTPVSVPDVDLAIASLAAVRTWTYKPYLLNGEPVSVDTTIIVNFDIR